MDIEKKTLYRCPGCGRYVPPIKRPSVAGIWFLVWFYLIYYYLLKKPECVYCGYRFSKNDVKTLETEEMAMILHNPTENPLS